jgi:hypothetical protein
MLRLSLAQWTEMDRRIGREHRAVSLAEELQRLRAQGYAAVSPDRVDAEVRAGIRWAAHCGLTSKRDTARLIALVCCHYGSFDPSHFPTAARSLLYDRRIDPSQRLEALMTYMGVEADVPELRTDAPDDDVDDLVAACPDGKPIPSWIEISLCDDEGSIMTGEEYLIVLPDGVEVRGHLDLQGRARVMDVDPGTCKITFPRLEPTMWGRA